MKSDSKLVQKFFLLLRMLIKRFHLEHLFVPICTFKAIQCIFKTITYPDKPQTYFFGHLPHKSWFEVFKAETCHTTISTQYPPSHIRETYTNTKSTGTDIISFPPTQTNSLMVNLSGAGRQQGDTLGMLTGKNTSTTFVAMAAPSRQPITDLSWLCFPSWFLLLQTDRYKLHKQ